MRVNPDPPNVAVDPTPRPKTPATPSVDRTKAPAGRGRPHTQGTKLAKIMRERRIRVHQIGSILRVGDRCMYNYLTRQRAIPALQLAALCDKLDMDPEELVDRRRFLLPDDSKGQ